MYVYVLIHIPSYVAECCHILQCVAASCSVLQCVAVCCRAPQNWVLKGVRRSAPHTSRKPPKLPHSKALDNILICIFVYVCKCVQIYLYLHKLPLSKKLYDILIYVR